MCDLATMFPFPLSEFQQRSIHAIAAGNHVFTAAPTGSGKTVSAEFAIRHFAVLGGRRVIYTSPIKALSNQKYWELSQQFPTVSFGLLTGDVKINPGADVLIMTTEILQNFLFASYNLIKKEGVAAPILHFSMNIETELACVIFDEVHYILDQNRGSVWERSILMLPEHIQLIMLSATFARPERFAEWVFARYNTRKVVVAGTNVRSVPLIHYAFFACTEAIHKILKDAALKLRIRAATNSLLVLKNARTEFNEQTHTEICAMHLLLDKHRIRISNIFAINKLLELLKEKDMLPAIIFVFSRKRAEYLASQIQTVVLADDSKVPYTAARRCDEILRRLPNHMEYTNLPEFDVIVKLAEKGVAYHHSGMLAVFREMVELLIAERFISVLVCTESFSIGLNCPIRTSIFTGISKFCDNGMRNLLPHEYQQCAGRAGRRGIDTVGYVIHCNSMFRESCKVAYRRLLSGMPPPLISTLRIDTLSILALIRAGYDSTYTICKYLSGTMMALDVHDMQRGARTELEYAQNMEIAARANMDRIGIPAEIVAEFAAATAAAKLSGGKSRLKLLNRIAKLRELYPTIESSAAALVKVDLAVADVATKLSAISMENEIEVNVKMAIKTLAEHKFVFIAEDEFELSGSGIMAATITEVNGMIAARCIEKLDYFKRESLEDVITWLALFADIKLLADEYKENNDEYKENTDSVKRLAAVICAELGVVAELDSVIPCIAFATIARRWVAAETELDCKVELQYANNAGISMGEFVRALLKVVALARECGAAVELMGQLDCAAKLAMVDKAVLKFVVTAQSLYV